MSRPDAIPPFQRALMLVFGIPISLAVSLIVAVGLTVSAIYGSREAGRRVMRMLGL